MSDVGKSAKKQGQLHPRVLRKLDTKRPKPTPKASHAKARKRFGYSYEFAWAWRGPPLQWTRIVLWFVTGAAANQAMRQRMKDCERYGDKGVLRGRGFRKEER